MTKDFPRPRQNALDRHDVEDTFQSAEQDTKADLPAVFIKYYPAYANGSMTVTELARICKLSRPTVYKYIKMVA